MNLLFSISDNYTCPLLTTLKSIKDNSEVEGVDVYILQKTQLKNHDLIDQFCRQLGMTYHPVIVGDNIFQDAPASQRWPESIYYRLLAHELLPDSIDKILYLDADILCINDIQNLYQEDISQMLYAAASHSKLEMSDTINRLRLRNQELKSYFNSGVLLMNLQTIRQTVTSEDIYNYIKDQSNILLLPDQDVLNALYGDKIKALPDELYNFDTRLPLLYDLMSQNEYDYDWVMDHTVILHFCGKDKPWRDNARGKFSVLYKHYRSRTDRIIHRLNQEGVHVDFSDE